MKRVFFVIGPESSGTRVTTTLLMSAGCEGDDSHLQRLDDYLEGAELPDEFEEADMIVLRRSVPHGGRFMDPDLGGIESRLEEMGEVTAVICVRDWYTNVRSKIRQGHQTNREDGYVALQHEASVIGEFLGDRIGPLYVFNTSVLFEDPARAITGLAEFTGLEFPDGVVASIFNADAQYE